MPDRRCATQGCTGRLPADTGSHCPRCGGTEFLPESAPRRRRPLRRLVAVAVVAAIVVAITGLTARRSSRPDLPPTNSAIRGDLDAALELTSRMSLPNMRDDAYAQIVRRALEPHDYEYACRAAERMTLSGSKDQALAAVVDDAIKTGQRAWARHAAEMTSLPGNRDAALKRILDASASK
jgi:hypothetical protein